MAAVRILFAILKLTGTCNYSLDLLVNSLYPLSTVYQLSPRQKDIVTKVVYHSKIYDQGQTLVLILI